MQRMETEVVINKPIQTVWDYINDDKNMTKWLDNFEKYEHVSGKQGAVGSKGKHYYLYGKREIVMDEEILEVREPEYIRLSLETKTMGMIIINELEKVDDKTTKLIASTEFTHMHWLIKLMQGMQGKKKVQALHNKQMQNLKELIEKEG